MKGLVSMITGKCRAPFLLCAVMAARRENGIDVLQRGYERRHIGGSLTGTGNALGYHHVSLEPPKGRPRQRIVFGWHPHGQWEEMREFGQPRALLDQGSDVLLPARQTHDHVLAQSKECVVRPQRCDWLD